MSHLVIYEVDDTDHYERFVAVDEAVALVERLRNGGNGSARIYRLEEIQFEIKAYYRVEVGAPASPVTSARLEPNVESPSASAEQSDPQPVSGEAVGAVPADVAKSAQPVTPAAPVTPAEPTATPAAPAEPTATPAAPVTPAAPNAPARPAAPADPATPTDNAAPADSATPTDNATPTDPAAEGHDEFAVASSLGGARRGLFGR